MDSKGTSMEEIHNRTPVFLSPTSATLWLDSSKVWKAIINDVAEECRQLSKSSLIYYEVNSNIGNVKNDSIEFTQNRKNENRKEELTRKQESESCPVKKEEAKTSNIKKEYPTRKLYKRPGSQLTQLTMQSFLKKSKKAEA